MHGVKLEIKGWTGKKLVLCVLVAVASARLICLSTSKLELSRAAALDSLRGWESSRTPGDPYKVYRNLHI